MRNSHQYLKLNHFGQFSKKNELFNKTYSLFNLMLEIKNNTPLGFVHRPIDRRLAMLFDEG